MTDYSIPPTFISTGASKEYCTLISFFSRGASCTFQVMMPFASGRASPRLWRGDRHLDPVVLRDRHILLNRKNR